jgi:purine-binding chemotaxis protein CheW
MPSSDQPALGVRLLGEIKSIRHAEGDAAPAEESVKVVLVRAGVGHYAFLGRDIQEILSGNEIFWVPGLPDFLPGLIHVRGDIESVIDIQRLLGAPPGASGATGRLIVMAVRQDFRSGILVDEVEDVVDLPRSAIQPPLITLEEGVRDLVAGEIRLGERLVPLLDLERLQARVTL